MTSGAIAAETVVSQWFEAFNARNLEEMLAFFAEDVDFYPLRINGCDPWYSGHEGIRDWWSQLNGRHFEHRIMIEDSHPDDNGRVISSGSLTLGDGIDLGPFCSLHSIHAGRIVTAHHYLSDLATLEQVERLRDG